MNWFADLNDFSSFSLKNIYMAYFQHVVHIYNVTLKGHRTILLEKKVTKLSSRGKNKQC
jgi:hypothetical protein